MTREEIEKNRIAWAESDRKRDAGLEEPKDVTILRNLAYAEDGLTEHQLDVYYPSGAEGKNLPVLINVHGGGWFYGDKELYRFYGMRLAQFGFVVINCNYRLAPEYPYPAAIEDVCRVVKWTLEHRGEYTQNGHWFMVGDSAGAQLVSQYCILASNAAYRKQLQFDTYDQIPDGVALNCGIYDMTDHVIASKEPYLQNLSGKQLELFESQLDYLNQDFPPAYLMASVNDGLRSMTTPMRKKLEEVQVPMVFAEYGNGTPSDNHVFHLNLYSENGKRCNAAEMAFFQSLMQS